MQSTLLLSKAEQGIVRIVQGFIQKMQIFLFYFEMGWLSDGM